MDGAVQRTLWDDPESIPAKLKAMPDPPEDGDAFGFLGGVCWSAVHMAVERGFLAQDQLKGVLKITFDIMVMGYKIGKLEEAGQ